MQESYYLRFRKIYVFSSLLLLIQPVFGKAPLLSPKEIRNAPPRIIRTCCSFGTDLQLGFIPFIRYNDITSLSEIGEHQYLGGKQEGNGNIYTRHGGFIDLGHLRDCADWTAYLYNLILASWENPGLGSTDLGFEGGNKKLILNITCEPDSFEMAQLAGKIAYDLSLWHEIATWFGASTVPLFPERYSSFSPEDLYSNLLGIQLAIQALQSNEDFNAAMTRLLAETLASLGAVKTRNETHDAMEQVQNIWWTNKKPLPNKKILLKRFLDSEYTLAPWLIPQDNKALLPFLLDKPANELNDLYRLEIKLNYHFPTKKIFGIRKKHFITQLNFNKILEQVSNEIEHFELKTDARVKRKNQRKQNRI